MISNLRVGQRVRIQSGTHAGSEGHVRFSGQTSFKEGNWIGLELDEPLGKNNGTVGGVPYFNCKPLHGIFLKSGSAIEVLEQPKSTPAKPTPKPTTSTSRTATSTTTRTRPNVVPAASGAKRLSVTPSVASSASSTSASKRLSISLASATAKPTRPSVVDRSGSPRKPPVSAPSSHRLSVSGLKSGTKAPVARTSSDTASIDRAISPTNVKSDEQHLEARTVAKPVASSSVTPTTSRATAQQAKLVEELQTKISLLEKKRQEDREKIKKIAELEEKNGHFETVLTKLNGKFQTLHQENADLKKLAKESSPRLEELEQQQAEHDSIVELAKLDLQLAEDQADSYKSELDNIRARLDELELENDILKEEKEELEKDMSPEEKTSQGWLQLQRENARLKEALIRLRDWSTEQSENLKDEIKLLQEDTQDLMDTKEKLDDTRSKLLAAEADGDDLREQLDAALGAETMVEQLTEKNFELSTEVDDLQKAIEHLEFVKELNEELSKEHDFNENQLREILDLKDGQVIELSRRILKQDEDLTDREYTISRFRELVTAMQTDLEDMRSSKEISEMEAQNLENSSRAIMDLNRQLQSSATNVTVKAIDMELRQLDADQASLQLSIIQLFVPEAFQTERDSILSLLRFKRIAIKSKLLHGFIKQRLGGSVAMSNEVNVQAACESLDRLVWTGSMCERFISSIESSPIDQFAKYESTYHELETTERLLNGYIENLKKDELDEEKVSEGLSRTTAVFRHLGELFFGNTLDAFAEEVLMSSQIIHSKVEITFTVVSAFQSDLLKIGKDTEGTGEDYQLFHRNSDTALSTLRTAKVVASKLLSVLRDMKSRSFSLDQDNEAQFQKCSDAASAIFEYFNLLGKTVVKVLSEDHEQPVTFTHLLTALRTVSAAHLKEDGADLFYKPLKLIQSLAEWMNELHSQASELSNLIEFEKPQPPWILRSKELQSHKAISAVAEDEIKSLKRDLLERGAKLKLSQQQVEEAQMKIELLDQRNKDANKKLDQIAELEEQLKAIKLHEHTLEETLAVQSTTHSKLEEERDKWMQKALERQPLQKAADKNTRNMEMVGSSAEMKSLRTELHVLQSANRVLRQHFNSLKSAEDHYSNSWLSKPLRSSSLRHNETGAHMRIVLNNIALLPFQSNSIQIQGKGKYSAYGKETPKYQLIQQQTMQSKAWTSLDSLLKGGNPVIVGLDVPEV